jgi:hypothetical protein
MSTASITPSQRAPVGTIVLIVLGVVPYAMVMAGMNELHDVDGISRGLAAVSAVVGIAILWIMLAILLVMGAANGRMPRWAAIAALILHPASLIAVGATVDLLSSPGFDWALIVPGVLPPLIAAYALWARLPGLHGILTEGATSGVVWVAVLLLSAMPWIGLAQRSAERAEARAREQQVPVVSEEERRAQATRDWQVQFEMLTPDSPLRDYLEYIKPGSPVRERALDEARLVTDRQAQAEQLIRDGMLVWLGDLWQLDVAPTPSLCDAFAAKLQKEAEEDRGKSSYSVVVEYLEIHLANLKWLASAQCDLNDALAAVEATARGYPEAPPRDRFLAALAQLRRS